jgi:hypothetical protein
VKAGRFRILRVFRISLGWILLLICLAWAFGALWFDFPIPTAGRHVLAFVFAAVALLVLVFGRRRWRAKLGVLLAFVVIAGWWLTIRPKEDRPWQPDVVKTGWADLKGDEVVLHNVRNCDYRTEHDFTPNWEDRTVHLSQITGADLAITYWGSPWMAHPIVSFRFADTPPVCFSIEARKVIGQEFSSLASLYRQAQLIYVVADERDSIRVRAVYRHGEDVYLYRTLSTPEQAKDRFLEYLRTLNQLHAQPRWYNVLTTNCTTSIREQRPITERQPWDWRILLNGKADEMLYQRHLVATANLPFAELKERSRINSRAHLADKDPDFFRRIREGTPGFADINL